MIVDGRAMAQDILAEVKEKLSARGISPVVRVVVFAPSAVTESYLRAKARAAEAAGMQFEVVELSLGATTEDAVAAVNESGADAVIVQLPLPTGLDEERILSSIPPEKDADALGAASQASGAPVPPVAAAIEEILLRTGVSVAGANAVVIGKGRLVGAPSAARLAALGAHVASYDEHTFTPDVLAGADIVVAGSGVAHLVKPEMVKEGVVLIDAGTTEANGVLTGDIDPACAEKASVYTPVPGGVGPLTVACLMRNVATLALHINS